MIPVDYFSFLHFCLCCTKASELLQKYIYRLRDNQFGVSLVSIHFKFLIGKTFTDAMMYIILCICIKHDLKIV